MILVGGDEWQGLLDWLRTAAVADHRLDAADLAGLHLESDPAQVAAIITATAGRRAGP